MPQKYAEFETPTFSLLGCDFQFLAGPEEGEINLGVVAGGIPVGRLAPLHSHPSSETICVLEGGIDVYRESDGWTHARAGEVVIIPPHIKHALRNTGTVDMKSIFVSDATLYQYFKDVCEPFPVVEPHQWGQQLKKIFAANARYGYWLGTPEENAAIGIELPKIPPPQ